MASKWMALLVGIALLVSGCQNASAPASTTEVTPVSDSTAVPGSAATVPSGDQPCRGRITAGPPSISVSIADVRFALPMSSCALTVPAGQITLSVQSGGRPVPVEPLTVTGATGGYWDGEFFTQVVTVKAAETRQVTFDLSPLGRTEPVTYTLSGFAAMPASFLASAPGRSGPWTPVPASGLVPADHTWLRIGYPLPMRPEPASVVTPDQDALTDKLLPGEFEGNQTQYVAIGDAPPILFLTAIHAASELEGNYRPLRMLYHGAPPELLRRNPETGKDQTAYQFTEVPEGLSYRDGVFRYMSRLFQEGRWQSFDRKVDSATGKLTAAPPPGADELRQRPEPGLMHFPSPDGKLVAELTWDSVPTFGIAATYRADLAIVEQATGKVLLQVAKWLTSQGSVPCGNGAPGFGWRPDNQAVSALDAPAPDRLVLKTTTLTGETRLMAERQGQGVGMDQFNQRVVWSPDGSMVVVGPQLVDAASGRVLTRGLAEYAYWSPDSRHLLLFQRNHVFTQWGTVTMLTPATGQAQELGHGQALGWSPLGEAVWIRWELSRQIPAPGKGCV